jgi:hypothetical protein
MQLSIFDDRTRVVQERASFTSREQTENMNRVRGRLAGPITDWCNMKCGFTFHAEQLYAYVSQRLGKKVAPASADRILRKLRQEGVVNYTCDRAKSLYRVTA